MINPEFGTNPEAFKEKSEKPETLYHASYSKEVDEFKPQALSVRDPEEGPLVFATPDFAMATCFLVRYEKTQSGRFDEIPYMVIANKDEFIKSDKGGAIYTLPNTTFYNEPEKGLGELEWVSKEAVKPTKKFDIPSALEAMLENGVQVYFVDEQTLKEIQSDPNHGRGILRKLTSENESRGINVKEIPAGEEDK